MQLLRFLKASEVSIPPLFNKISNRLDAVLCALYLLFLRSNRQISFSKLRLIGIPVIDVRNGGHIFLGRNVLLNSRNFGYHLSLYGPVKLMADRPGAVIRIGENSRIHGSCLHAYSSIDIGSNCLIAGNSQLMDASGHGLSFDDVDNRINTKGTASPITIEDSVWIGANAIILPGVHIGKGSVIGAGSVVTAEIPPRVLAAGNPARVVRDYEHSGFPR